MSSYVIRKLTFVICVASICRYQWLLYRSVANKVFSYLLLIILKRKTLSGWWAHFVKWMKWSTWFFTYCDERLSEEYKKEKYVVRWNSGKKNNGTLARYVTYSRLNNAKNFCIFRNIMLHPDTTKILFLIESFAFDQLENGYIYFLIATLSSSIVAGAATGIRSQEIHKISNHH